MNLLKKHASSKMICDESRFSCMKEDVKENFVLEQLPQIFENLGGEVNTTGKPSSRSLQSTS